MVPAKVRPDFKGFLSMARPLKSATRQKLDVVVQARLEPDVARKLDQLAKLDSGYRSDLMRVAIHEYVDRNLHLLPEEAA